MTRFEVGDEVLGIGAGSFAEYCVALERKLVRKPADLTFDQAAALPVSGLTALQAVEAAGVTAGERVAVIGASGGVGVYAVQLVKAAGAQVTAVCSAGKADLVRELGADEVLDYHRDSLPESTFDVVLAIGGQAPVGQLRRALTASGRLLIVGGEGGGQILGIGRQLRAVAWNPLVRQKMAMLLSKESGEDLQRLVDLVATGAVRPVVGQVYPLAEGAAALQDMADGMLRGKAVLRVIGD